MKRIFTKHSGISKAFGLCIIAICGSLAAQGQVVINEIMQSNIVTVFADNDFPDSWVELYNAGPESVNLNGYTLGIKDSPAKGYTFPQDIEIPADGYVMVYCDKEASGMHTSFRLESGKGEVYLFDPSGEVISHVSHPKMPAVDLSYALKSTESGEWSYAVTPTPGAPNETVFSNQLLPQPEFSVAGGLYDAPFELVVSIPEGSPEDAMLCVTLDGREPTLDNQVEGNSYTLDIEDTKVVRGKIISPSALASWSVAHSYIFHPREITLPVVSVSTADDYLYDDEIGMFATGIDSENPNYMQEWRRPINIEYFPTTTDGAVINQLAETAIQGNASRTMPQKSLKVYANKRFGTKRLNYAFWADKPDVSAEIKSISLRNSGNDFLHAHIRDAFLHTLFGPNMNIDYMAYQPAIYYLNGKYHGIIDIRERSNEDFVAANYNGLEDIFMIENRWELKAGNWEEYYDFEKLFTNPDTPYETLAEKLDMDSFIDYCIVEFYGYNQDFPANNAVMWRDLLNNGKFRFILKDLDWTAFADPEKDYISYLDGSDRPGFAVIDDISASLYLLCLSYPEFRDKFIDRYAVLFGDYLHKDHVCALLEEMIEEITPEYLYHCQTFDLPYLYWKNERLQKIRSFYDGRRNDAILEQLKNRYKLGELYNLVFVPMGETWVNGNKLTQPRFDGKLFNGRSLCINCDEELVPELTVEDEDGNTYIVTGRNGFVKFTPYNAKNISMIFKDKSAVDLLYMDDSDDSTPEYYTLTGNKVSNPVSGIYIMRKGNRTQKVVIP